MQNYNLDAHLAGLYDHYPEGNTRPVIGITTNFSGQDVTIREVFQKLEARRYSFPLPQISK